MTDEHILSRTETAARLGISVPTLRRLVAAGALPPPRQITLGRVGHLASEVNEYLRSRPVEPLRGRTAAAIAARRAPSGEAA